MKTVEALPSGRFLVCDPTMVEAVFHLDLDRLCKLLEASESALAKDARLTAETR